ncbi:hypothetical protein [Microvirga arsenatis]|uniref:hypothetical protein n=1 Tax=Microvirga arsenatis TaxID=2692265 RepID=UPI001FE77AC0|nr:hypothetical protein [Microvirga arsenatis]
MITDALSLSGQRPPLFASGLLARTERIARLLERLHDAPVVRAMPLPCRWLPLRAGPKSVRIGDAHASFDPLAGRGLWEAIRRAEEIALALDTDPALLESIERSSKKAYQRYLAERADFYRDGCIRFGTDFWVRRCLSESIQSEEQPI